MIKSGAIENLAVSRAEKAILAGADGVIASPKELKLLKRTPFVRKRLLLRREYDRQTLRLMIRRELQLLMRP